jgi:uncharacterized membrane protein YcaP (DUF421 family)
MVRILGTVVQNETVNETAVVFGAVLFIMFISVLVYYFIDYMKSNQPTLKEKIIKPKSNLYKEE